MTVLIKTNNGQILLVSQTSVFCLTSTMMRLYCSPVILSSVLVLILNERTKFSNSVYRRSSRNWHLPLYELWLLVWSHYHPHTQACLNVSLVPRENAACCEGYRDEIRHTSVLLMRTHELQCKLERNHSHDRSSPSGEIA